MATRFAEHRHHQLRAAVDDNRDWIEIRRRVDESAQPHHPLHFVQIAPARGLHLRQQIEPAQPRGRLALLDLDGVAELAFDAARRIDRDLPRHVHQIAHDHERHIGRHRRRRRWQGDAQFPQPRFNPPHRPLPIAVVVS
jgi:hypothetical protein